MKKFSANTLEAALIEATRHFNCSLTQIEYEVIQNPSSGFLGFFKKEAIIVAEKKQDISIINTESTQIDPEINQDMQTKQFEINTQKEQTNNVNNITPLNTETNLDSKEVSTTTFQIDKINNNASTSSIYFENTENNNQTLNQIDINTREYTDEKNKSFNEIITNNAHIDKNLHENKNNQKTFINESKDEKLKDNKISESRTESSLLDSNHTQIHTNTEETIQIQNTFISHKKPTDEMQGDFDSNFYNKHSNTIYQDETSIHKHHKKDIETICKEVQGELTELLSYLPLKLDKIHVEPYDNNTLFILIDGFDAALLIGQKGYRYKSLSYLLFNWINTCYNYGVRLEIAQFLKNQEETMKAYLETIIESAKLNGKAQTKPFDDILTHIALKMLRDALPNKYIVFRENADGEKYISINEFISSSNIRNNMHGFGNLPKY